MKTDRGQALRAKLGQAAATSIHERSMNVEGMAKRHLALYEAVAGAA